MHRKLAENAYCRTWHRENPLKFGIILGYSSRPVGCLILNLSLVYLSSLALIVHVWIWCPIYLLLYQEAEISHLFLIIEVLWAWLPMFCYFFRLRYSISDLPTLAHFDFRARVLSSGYNYKPGHNSLSTPTSRLITGARILFFTDSASFDGGSIKDIWCKVKGWR